MIEILGWLAILEYKIRLIGLQCFLLAFMKALKNIIVKIITSVVLFFFFNTLSAQPGCIDPQATNFDANATENDGSCLYPMTSYDLTEIIELPETLKECSGVELINSGLWIHNDGGNPNQIFRIDSLNGTILQTIVIDQENVDWEGFAENEDYLFLGDFGNNPGNRTDLKILRINKNDLSNDTVDVQLIEFEYNDQVDFSENNNNHNFDCEAFIFFNGQLHLFSKNWADNQTKHYALSAEPGIQTAQLKETFNVNGLITGADISEENEVVLLGYTEFGFNFMWLLFDFEGDNFFSGNKRFISFGTALTNSQTEGITFRGNGYGYIVSEEFKVNDQITLPQKMLSFSISQWINELTPILEIFAQKSVTVYPNPFQNYFELENQQKISVNWRLYDGIGRIVKEGKTASLKTKIDTSTLPSGFYNLQFFLGNEMNNISLFKE